MVRNKNKRLNYDLKNDQMHESRLDLATLHYTRWVFYLGERQLPSYVPAFNQPFFIVSIYERSGPEFTKHLLIPLN